MLPSLRILTTVFRDFSRENWWVYIVFIVSFVIIAWTGRGNSPLIMGLFLLQFAGDLAVMVMMQENALGNYQTAFVYQTIETLFFVTVVLIGWYVDSTWQYVAMQVFFTLANVKS